MVEPLLHLKKSRGWAVLEYRPWDPTAIHQHSTRTARLSLYNLTHVFDRIGRRNLVTRTGLNHNMLPIGATIPYDVLCIASREHASNSHLLNYLQ
jgi:hypothetical protein